jgi:hypothetical protein
MSKLGQLLLVVLSSDQPGEVAAAIAALRKQLDKAGRDIHWLADQLSKIVDAPAVTKHVPGHVRRTAQSGLWWLQLEFCIGNLEKLREREAEFIESLMDQWTVKDVRWTPSAKQLRWLQNIYDRLQMGDPFGRW